MTREDTQKVIAVVMALYSNFQPQDLTATINAWHWALEEYTYNDVSLALKAFVKSGAGKGFAPNADQLISYIHKPSEMVELNELDAWALVRKALSNSNYNADKEFEKLPATIQNTLGSADQLRAWASTNIDEVETVIGSNFQRNYRAQVKRQQEINRLPENTKMKVLTEATVKQLEAKI